MTEIQVLKAKEIMLRSKNLNLEQQAANTEFKRLGHILRLEADKFNTEFPWGFNWDTMKPNDNPKAKDIKLHGTSRTIKIVRSHKKKK